MESQFIGSYRECKELVETYNNCFNVIKYELNPIDIGLDRWELVVRYEVKKEKKK
jgi:hypothetical protein